MRCPGGPDFQEAKIVTRRMQAAPNTGTVRERSVQVHTNAFVYLGECGLVGARTPVCGIGGGCGIYTCSGTRSPGSGRSELLTPQERADPSLPRDLFKYSVRNNGI